MPIEWPNMFENQAINQRPKLREYRTANGYKAPAAPSIAPGYSPPPDYKDKNLTKKARAKFLSWSLNRELLKCDKSPIYSQYKISANCAQLIQTKGTKLITAYCGYRWCLVCNRIRTAKLIDKYAPMLAEMPDPVFITLTLKSITDADKLRPLVRRFVVTINKIFDRLRKHGIKFQGFRKLEITHGAAGFHPHLHLLVSPIWADKVRRERKQKNIQEVRRAPEERDGLGVILTPDYYQPAEKTTVKKTAYYKETDPAILAKLWIKAGGKPETINAHIDNFHDGKITLGELFGHLIIRLWLTEVIDLTADIKGQDVRKADQKSIKELFKYSVKTAVKAKQQRVKVEILDAIFCSLRGTRTIQPVGWTAEQTAEFNRINENLNEDLSAQEYEQSEEYLSAPVSTYYWRQINGRLNWYNIESGAPLVKYYPSNKDLLYLQKLQPPNNGITRGYKRHKPPN